MKVLVIGAQGQLARSLLELAESVDSSVVAVGRPELDLLNPTTLTRAIDEAGSDVVINTAAYTAVDKAEAEPELAYAINAEGAGRVAEACARAEIRPSSIFPRTMSSTGSSRDPTGRPIRWRRLVFMDSPSLKASAASPIAVRGISFCGLLGSTARSGRQLRQVDVAARTVPVGVGVVDDQVGNSHLRAASCSRYFRGSSPDILTGPTRTAVGN